MHDIDTYAFRDYPAITDNQRIHQTILPDMTGHPRHDVIRCGDCGEILNKWTAPLDKVIVIKRRYDVGSTYDGISIVSKRFKTIYVDAKLKGLTFRMLPDDPRYYAVMASRIVLFDAERRGTRFIKLCESCNHYESVVGAKPVYLKSGSKVKPNEFVRTDIEFASNDEKHPLLLCGESAASVLKSAKLKGLNLESCYDLDNI